MAKRQETVRQRCKVCADQMFGDPRCYEHNPTPEQRAQGADSTNRPTPIVKPVIQELQ